MKRRPEAGMRGRSQFHSYTGNRGGVGGTPFFNRWIGCLVWRLPPGRCVRGRPHDSRSGDRRYNPAINKYAVTRLDGVRGRVSSSDCFHYATTNHNYLQAPAVRLYARYSLAWGLRYLTHSLEKCEWRGHTATTGLERFAASQVSKAGPGAPGFLDRLGRCEFGAVNSVHSGGKRGRVRFWAAVGRLRGAFLKVASRRWRGYSGWRPSRICWMVRICSLG